MNGSKLTIVCSAMLQSWRNTGLGPDCRYTELAPTKSGITGMLACALGYPRGDERIGQLMNSFELYLDNDASGSLTGGRLPDTLMDFQTVSAPKGGMLTADAKRRLITPSIIMREYIVGYRYVLYIVADDGLLKSLESALNNPVWNYYLGSKCCIPAEKVCRGIQKIKEGELDGYQYIYA